MALPQRTALVASVLERILSDCGLWYGGLGRLSGAGGKELLFGELRTIRVKRYSD